MIKRKLNFSLIKNKKEEEKEKRQVMSKKLSNLYEINSLNASHSPQIDKVNKKSSYKFSFDLHYHNQSLKTEEN